MPFQKEVAVSSQLCASSPIGYVSSSRSLAFFKDSTCYEDYYWSSLRSIVLWPRVSPKISAGATNNGYSHAVSYVRKLKRDLCAKKKRNLGVELKSSSDGSNQNLSPVTVGHVDANTLTPSLSFNPRAVNYVRKVKIDLFAKKKRNLDVELKAGLEGSNQNLSPMTVGHVNSNTSTSPLSFNSPLEDVAVLRPFPNGSPSGAHQGTEVLQSKRLRVAVDVDEVLGSFLSSLNTFIEEQHLLKYDISEYHVYDFMKIWGCSQSEANDRVHEFFESEHFKDGIAAIPGAHRSLLQLADFCDFVVVTSRQHVIRNQTLDWIERHYPGVFSDVYFGNHFALEGAARPKSEICRSIGAEILVDDNPRYAVECAHHDIEVLLFDHNLGYPWSKTVDGPVHPRITRVQNWQEVELMLLARASEKR